MCSSYDRYSAKKEIRPVRLKLRVEDDLGKVSCTSFSSESQAGVSIASALKKRKNEERVRGRTEQKRPLGAIQDDSSATEKYRDRSF